MRLQMESALKDAILTQDRRRMGTLRLMLATIRDRDGIARAAGREKVSDQELLEILGKMIRQRLDSAAQFEEAARLELAEQEREEIAIIKEFLPRQLSEAEMRAICSKAIEETGAQGLRDMGRCMSTLKSRYAGQMDFGRASQIVKEQLQ
ncbi:MAG: GatB/YqeY domain-containing protein [Bauldia sp.]|nr:GatB/YqeY domain-containing protein [Bauldia sp.]